MAFHYRRLGQNMRRIRLGANMTQRAIAEALGYRSCEHWSRIESGVRHIPLQYMEREIGRASCRERVCKQV